jgi:dihydrofolate reductase
VRPTFSVFVGTSLDGFIARPDGALDWLPEGAEPHGYDEFFAGIDTLLIGRKTLDTVLGFDGWPYGDKRVVALSRSPFELPAGRAGAVEWMSGTPAEIAERLGASGARNVYLDGGITVQGFLREGLVDRMTITRVPVLLGSGIPLFGGLPGDVRLRHVATRWYPSGLVQSEYDVVR